MLGSRQQTVLFADSENHHNVAASKSSVKTPGTQSRRRAFGDISNRKAAVPSLQKVQFGTTIQKQRAVTFASSSKSKTVSNSILPSRSSTTTTTTTPSRTPKTIRPMEDVEFKAGRSYNPFDDEDDELNLSIDFSSPVPVKHTPAFWMNQFDFDDTHHFQDNNKHGFDDDASLMVAPDELYSNAMQRAIDLSLEDEVDALGVSIADISF